jgi:acyl carrier protein
MNSIEFLAELQDILQRDDPLEPGMILKELPEWDSLSMLAVAALFDEQFSISLTFDDFRSFSKISDLLDKAGLK